MTTITKWKFFAKNYLKISLVFTFIFILSTVLSFFRNESDWYFGIIFLIFAWVVLPIGSNLTYNKRFK
jgi:hypothetical protein